VPGQRLNDFAQLRAGAGWRPLAAGGDRHPSSQRRCAPSQRASKTNARSLPKPPIERPRASSDHRFPPADPQRLRRRSGEARAAAERVKSGPHGHTLSEESRPASRSPSCSWPPEACSPSVARWSARRAYRRTRARSTSKPRSSRFADRCTTAMPTSGLPFGTALIFPRPLDRGQQPCGGALETTSLRSFGRHQSPPGRVTSA
jgi:hypothetical protein